MLTLIRQLIRPYRGTLFIILMAMLVETAMSLASPWPLKIIIDNGSFNSRRELAIEVRDKEVVDRVHKLVHHDWENSRPMDLSDQGLLADLGEEQGGEIVSPA